MSSDAESPSSKTPPPSTGSLPPTATAHQAAVDEISKVAAEAIRAAFIKPSTSVDIDLVTASNVADSAARIASARSPSPTSIPAGYTYLLRTDRLFSCGRLGFWLCGCPDLYCATRHHRGPCGTNPAGTS
ncbi:hypothetical protein OsI_11346 [Oryza sativa Indica Group]|uniref:Uncharacterized protein n=1 Tax=Oryza sativa subsp. indica TaxID=39946 RepID=A2XG38_ORYSI|nr:hypothetical protein OsI_11346 [Oryza sativa Indica Group]